MKQIILLIALTFAVSSATAGFKEGVAAFEDRNYTKAVKEFEPLAKKGSANAQYYMGEISSFYCSELIRHTTKSVTETCKEMKRWFQQAATQDYADAQLALGDIYAFSMYAEKGIPGNPEEAAKWRSKAAEQYLDLAKKGQAEGQYKIANMYETGRTGEQNYEEALKWYLEAAKQKYIRAYVSMAAWYSIGTPLTPKDDVEKLKWYRLAADAGDPESMKSVGKAYLEGRGVPRDPVIGASWYRRAIEQGHLESTLTYLASLYETGEKVPRDLVLAYAYNKVLHNMGTNTHWYRMFGKPNEGVAASVSRIATKLSPEQLAEGNSLAASWKPWSQLPATTKTGDRNINASQSEIGCQPPAGSVLRYSDSCRNGDCVRTFENGCQRKFQAPFCFDTIQQRWTWKPDGC